MSPNDTRNKKGYILRVLWPPNQWYVGFWSGKVEMKKGESVCRVCAEESGTAELRSKGQLQQGQGKERLGRGGVTQLAQIYGPNFQF